MPWRALLSAILGAGLVVVTPEPPITDATRAVPPEADVTLLPPAAVLQAVAGDVDGDGVRELVRLVRDADSATLVEVWRQEPGGWVSAGDAARVLPAARRGVRDERVYAGAAVRLLVWSDGDRERVAVASQPQFELIDAGPACCLLLSDIAMGDSGVSLAPIADATYAVESVLMLDLDGDAADELLFTRAVEASGPIGLQLEAGVLRWNGTAFVQLIVAGLPFGGTGRPFVLGDSDGRPGLEAGLVGTVGPAGLVRISLDGSGTLRLEPTGLTEAVQAAGVELEDGPGLLIVDDEGLQVLSWPAGRDASVTAEVSIADARLLGVVELGNSSRAVVHRPGAGTLHLFSVPDLASPPGEAVTRTAAAAALSGSPARAHVGRLPGGGPDGRPAVIFAGRFIASVDEDPMPFPTPGVEPMSTLAGAVPVGLLGEGRGWMAIEHVDVQLPPLAPEGGDFEPPVARPGAWHSIVPLADVLTPEVDEGILDPGAEGLIRVEGRRTPMVGPQGFVASLAAPPGSRIIAAGPDPSFADGFGLPVPDSGRVTLTLPPPQGSLSNARYRAALVVVTPAGRGYVASWTVELLNAPPPLQAAAETPFGSGGVSIRGAAPPYATVLVNGRAVPIDEHGRFVTHVELPPWPSQVEIQAVDPIGNRATARVSGVGFFDYRRLPWIPISVFVTLAAAAVLYLRVPRLRPVARRADDDAALEELEPD